MHRASRRITQGACTLACLLTAFACTPCRAAVGIAEIVPSPEHGLVTVFYPTGTEPKTITHGPFVLSMAENGAPARGNGRLVLISHGSGGSPWVHADIASALVDAGFVVALPAHRGDNYRDDGSPGPDSWTIRPAELSKAIDAVAGDPRFSGSIDPKKVGVYGMSAGGHAALSLAGGRWSPASFARYCEGHVAEDFQSCVGLISRLTGGPLDWLRTTIASAVIRLRFRDDTVRIDHDPRVAAIVAAVPFAADFDPASLERPVVPLGLITAHQDRWLIPRFHGERIVAACRTCEQLVDLREGGHGGLLSPLPPGMTGLIGALLNDPPGFDRPASTALVDDRTVEFFRRHLLDGAR